jgi:hypothetical protein
MRVISIVAALIVAGCSSETYEDGLLGPILFDGGDTWVLGSSLARCDHAGSCTQVTSTPGNGGEIAVDERFVYWTNARYDRASDRGIYTLHRLAKAGGAPETLAESEHALAFAGGPVARLGDWLYWIDGYGPARLMRIRASASGPIEQVAEIDADPRLAQLVAGDTAVFWTSGSDLHAQPLAADAIATIAAGLSTPIAMLWHRGALLVADSTREGGSILRLDPSTGEIRTLAAGQRTPASIAVDDRFVYWTNSGISDPDPGAFPEGGAIHRAPLAGGDAELVRAGLDAPQHVAVGPDALAWTDWGGFHTMEAP